MHKMQVAVIHMLRRIYDKTCKDRIINVRIKSYLGIAIIEDKIREKIKHDFNLKYLRLI